MQLPWHLRRVQHARKTALWPVILLHHLPAQLLGAGAPHEISRHQSERPFQSMKSDPGCLCSKSFRGSLMPFRETQVSRSDCCLISRPHSASHFLFWPQLLSFESFCPFIRVTNVYIKHTGNARHCPRSWRHTVNKTQKSLPLQS